MHLGHSGHDDHLSHSQIISEGWRSQPFLQKPVPRSLNLQSNCTAVLCCSTPEYNTECCSYRLGISTCSMKVMQVGCKTSRGFSGQAKTMKTFDPPRITAWHNMLPLSNNWIWACGHGAPVERLHMVLKCYFQIKVSGRIFSCGIIVDFSSLLDLPKVKIDRNVFFIWGQ